MIIRIAEFILAIFSSYFISPFRRIIYVNRNNAPPIENGTVFGSGGEHSPHSSSF